jgi:proteasome lid subunit RPN8/RPN11
MMGRPGFGVHTGIRVSSLTMPASMFDAIVRHLHEWLPNEGVGLVAVAHDAEELRATAFLPGTNIDRSPTRYTMDPVEVVAGLRMIDANGWQLGAIVHSHVLTPPTPSATDLREAYYPDALMLIVGFGTGQAEPRLWRLDAADRTADPVEMELVVEPDQRAAAFEQGAAGPVAICQESQACDS